MDDLPRRPAADHHTGLPGPLRPRMLRVLVVGVSWPMETFIERLLTGLSARGLEVTLLTLNPAAGRPPEAWLRQHRTQWRSIAPPSRRQLVRDLRHRDWEGVRGQVARLRARHAALDELSGRWDVVYAPWLNALTSRPAEWAEVAPVVTSCRGALVTIAPWDPARAAHRAALPRLFDAATLVHCVSDAIALDAAELGLDPAKVRVIRPAVDPSVFVPPSQPPVRSGPIRILSVGTLNWRKDHEHALVALRRAVDDGADLVLDVVGDGAERQHLVFAIDDLHLGDRVRLWGRRSPAQVAAHVRAADVFLHTSSSEGISNAVLEAMAGGLPVVTTSAGGMREAVRHGEDGYVVGVRDVAATAAALVALHGDPSQRARMGTSARRRIIDDFQLDDQVSAFVSLLHEAAAR